MNNFGAYPQIAATRKEQDISSKVELYTSLTFEEYVEYGKSFNSPLFDFTMKNFNVKRKEFCYAGDWTFTLNLATGIMSRCYASPKGYDIFKNVDKPIHFCAVGKHCDSLFCMNSSHFMSLGVIPEVDTPSYSDLRDRVCEDQTHWYGERMQKFLSQKLEDNNSIKCNKAKVEIQYLFDKTYRILSRIYNRLKQK